MFRVTRYPMIYKAELGQVGYRKKYRVAGRVRVPAGHWLLYTLIHNTDHQRITKKYSLFWDTLLGNVKRFDRIFNLARTRTGKPKCYSSEGELGGPLLHFEHRHD